MAVKSENQSGDWSKKTVGSASKKANSTRLKGLVQDFYKRKNILDLSQFEKERPDLAFCWLNYPSLAQSSFYNENGWRPYVPAVNENKEFIKDQYNAESSFGVKSVDNLVHRSEMVLCCMPKEQYEDMKEAEQLARKIRDNTDFFKNRPGLDEFAPTSSRVVEKVSESEI